jgi:micrococcal nuclease
MSYEYKAKLVRVIDGDTVRLKLYKTVDIGFYITQTATYEGNFRLAGINTPEIRGPEKEEGLKAKQFVVDKITSANLIRVVTYKPDKYGRWLADIFLSFSDATEEFFLNDELIKQGHATTYLR